jgi:hypothetical protein
MEQFRVIIKWRGREIEVIFNPDWCSVYREVYGYALGHLEIRSVNGAPLPISKTGYQSKFERTDNVDAEGGAAGYVLAWLDHAAQACKHAPEPDPNQLCLF